MLFVKESKHYLMAVKIVTISWNVLSLMMKQSHLKLTSKLRDSCDIDSYKTEAIHRTIKLSILPYHIYISTI